MPMKKRTYRKRARRATKRRTMRPRRGLAMSRVHNFKYTTLVKNRWQIEMNGVDQNFAIPFTLNDIPNVAELTALFDLYRINAVKYKIVPRQTEMIYQTAAGKDEGGSAPVPNTDFGGTHLFGASNFGHPEILTVIDFDDDTNPANTNELLQYNNLKITRGNRVHMRYLKPRIKVDSSNTGLSLRHQWLDCDNSGVKHYGLKGQFANIPNISPYGTSDHPVINYDVYATYYISFRETR